MSFATSEADPVSERRQPSNPAEGGMGLRERRKAEARARIVESALTLFNKRGYTNVTVDEIAEHASVSRRSFFRYFPSKESVVMDRRLGQLAQLREALEKAPREASALQVLSGALVLLAPDYDKNRTRILAERALFASARELSTRDMEIDRDFELVLYNAVKERIEPSPSHAPVERRARLFAAAAMGALRVILDEWAANEGRLSLLEVGAPVLDVLERLLVLAPAAKAD